MKKNVQIIVGDDYWKFTDGANVITVTTFYEKLSTYSAGALKDYKIYLGQGLSTSVRENLIRHMGSLGAEDIVFSENAAPCNLTHKITEDNAMISRPRIIERYHHQYDLIVNDKIDRLSDHVTGKHIGAMPIMEAARQATISILESAFMSSDKERYGMVLNSYRSDFIGFLFPIPATINATILEKNMSSNTKLSVVVESEVFQNGAKIATVSLDVTLIEKKKLEEIETRRAKVLLNSLLNPKDTLLELQFVEKKLVSLEV
jgi:hypothetical protein